MSDGPEWFAPRRHGFGSGLPVSWQGWLLTLVYAAAMLGGHIQPMAGAMGEGARWRVVLPRQITHPVLIRALSERHVPIFAFEPIKPGLEGAFWHLAQHPELKSRAACRGNWIRRPSSVCSA